MAEQLRSITDARRSLREISETAQLHMDRYIITNQGQPQSVLLGYKEYQGLKATVELLNRPAEMERLQTGLEQLNRGKRLTFNEMKESLGRRRAQQVQAKNAPSFAGIKKSAKYSAAGKPEPVNDELDDLQTLIVEASPLRPASRDKFRAARVRFAPAVGKVNG